MKISPTVLLAAIFTTSKAVVPNYSPVIGGNAALSRGEAIQTYFNLGFKAQEIVLFLVSVYGVRISVRHLKRILRRLSCSRRRFQSNLDDTTVYKGERFQKEFILDIRTYHKPTETFQLHAFYHLSPARCQEGCYQRISY